jgi:hypothetical protein
MAPNSANASSTQGQDDNKERGREKFKWLKLLRMYPERTPTDYLVGSVILELTRSEYGNVIIDQEHLARYANVSVRSVATSTKRLAQWGFIEKSRTKGHGLKAINIYKPVFPDEAPRGVVVPFTMRQVRTSHMHEVHVESESHMHQMHARTTGNKQGSGNKQDAESEIGSVPKSIVSVCDGVGAACAAHAHTGDDLGDQAQGSGHPAGNPTHGHARASQEGTRGQDDKRSNPTAGHPPKLATSDGRHVGNSRKVSAGKGSPRRGAGGPPQDAAAGWKGLAGIARGLWLCGGRRVLQGCDKSHG